MQKIRAYVASFLIVCLAIVGIDVNFNESRASLKAVAGITAGQTLPTGLTIPSPTFTGTVTLGSGPIVGAERIVAQSAIPFIVPSSGSVGNNGALSGLTALSVTYSNGCWMYFAADVIAAGVAAGWYWVVMSSTTAGTIYNSTYTAGNVPALGTQTAFATTGPGAYTGQTGAIIGPAITIAADAVGLNGTLRVDTSGGLPTNNGNNKILRAYHNSSIAAAGSNFLQLTQTTVAQRASVVVQNQGIAAAQAYITEYVGQVAATNAANDGFGTINTAATNYVLWTLQHSTATDNAILQRLYVGVRYGS